MVSTRRSSRSQGGDSDFKASEPRSSQEEVTSTRGEAARQPAALQPIIEEVPADAQQGPEEVLTLSSQVQTRGSSRGVRRQQQRVAKQLLEQPDEPQQQQQLQQQQQQRQQQQQLDPLHQSPPPAVDVANASGGRSDSADEGIDDWGLDFDGPGVLQNLADAIQSGFNSQSGAQQQHQPQQRMRSGGVTLAPAASRHADLDDAALQELRWRPHTGLHMPAKAAAALALVRPRQGRNMQQQDEPLGALVDSQAQQDAAAEQKDTAAAAAAAAKPSGLSKALTAPTLDAAARTKEAKKAAPDTAGSKWFGLPAPKINDDLKRDLRLLRLRGAYDPKRFYKSFDDSKFPKYFAIGTVVDDPCDNNRLSRGQRRATLTEQLLADSELSATRKKRYNKLQDEAQQWVKHKKRKTNQPHSKRSKHRPKH